jgi:hypothetical protein
MATCNWCDKDFNPSPGSTGKFCSEDCYGSWCSEERTGEESPVWKGGKIAYTCEWCGETAKDYPSRAGRFCSQSCATSARQQGEDNPRYSGGGGHYFSEAIRVRLSDWAVASRLCRKRADHECELCGKSRKEATRLDAHHIVPVLAGGTNTQENLMCVCAECHPRVEAVSREVTGHERLQLYNGT